jgi:hypothetical protein
MTNNAEGFVLDTTCRPVPELMTEDELILYLRIPEVSKAKDYHNVVYNLKRMHDLPCIHISNQPLYPHEAIIDWIRSKTEKGK